MPAEIKKQIFNTTMLTDTDRKRSLTWSVFQQRGLAVGLSMGQQKLSMTVTMVWYGHRHPGDTLSVYS